MSYNKITSVDQLKNHCAGERKEYFIHIGVARSSKTIEYDKDTDEFTIYHEIDDTWEEEVKSENLGRNNNIEESINKGTFYSYD